MASQISVSSPLKRISRKDAFQAPIDNLAPQAIMRVKINFPMKVTIINLQRLYLVKPRGMYMISSGIGVTAAMKAANQPYFDTSISNGRSLILVLSSRNLRPKEAPLKMMVFPIVAPIALDKETMLGSRKMLATAIGIKYGIGTNRIRLATKLKPNTPI